MAALHLSATFQPQILLLLFCAVICASSILVALEPCQVLPRIIHAYVAVLHSMLDVFLSIERLLSFPSQTWLSLCMVLSTKTFLFFFGRYDMMVQFSEKANVEEFSFLPFSCSSSLAPLPCREPLASLGSSREFHLTACQCNGADCIVHCDESDKLRRGVLKSTKKFAVVNCRLRSESA
ncbi:hypothetical protein T03_16339 [Trichinella britovi]|uniref:Uncharacterized protein n=1 Tax=Trichinella britovi TaxID=45882 RepID=A0A0V1C3H0_TRIBR|nr:hypothetical protein T03_16339 [Trichinella britovi]